MELVNRRTLWAGLVVAGIAGTVFLGNQRQSFADAASAAGATLTNEQVGAALDTYGKNTVTNNGHTEYNITVPKGKWKINVTINLSPNGKVIWLTNSLSAMPDKASADALVNALKKNAEIGPMFFEVRGGSLALTYPVPNYDLTPESFRADVDTLVATVLDTETLWSPDTLSGAAAAPANPLAK
jgi:hypothetical protein